MKQVIYLLSIFICYSCEPSKEEIASKINSESLEIMNLSFTYMKLDCPNVIINEDSFRMEYKKIANDSAELGLLFANKTDSITRIYRNIVYAKRKQQKK